MAEIVITPAQTRGWRFGEFTLDLGKRQLARNGDPVPLGARYFDALVLLLDADGAVVEKDRFIEEAWHGVPVTDEALTQGIRALRKALGDDASAPTFIATIPRRGYRFLAELEKLEELEELSSPSPLSRSNGLAGALLPATAAGALAGLLVGATYGTLAAGPGSGNVLSALLVLTLAGFIAGAAAGAGVGLGLTAARRWIGVGDLADLLGAVVGGAGIGMIGRMIALDGFELLVGGSPSAMTGSLEGAAMGAVIAVGLIAGRLLRHTGLATALGAVLGGAVAGLIAMAGGRFFAGSLAALLARFADSRLSFGALANALGEPSFGAVSQTVTASFEGAAFCGLIVYFVLRNRAGEGVQRPARWVV